MQRTYWIRYNSVGVEHFDKIVHKSAEDRPRWHKVEALTIWKESHKGYGWMTISHVFTKEEMKESGYEEEIR